MAVDPKIPAINPAGPVAGAVAGAVNDTAAEPIIIDLGKKNRKQVRKLRKGKPGRLMNRVEDAVEHLRENGSLAPDAQPVVIIVRQRAKRKATRITKAWGLG